MKTPHENLMCESLKVGVPVSNVN